MKRLLLVAAGLLIVVACNDTLTNPDAALVPGPQFSKWSAIPPDGCTSSSVGVKYQQQDAGGFRITGTAGNDTVDCTNASFAITFSGGDGDDTFYGGTGDDQLVGGNGDDYLIGGGGTDRISGGTNTVVGDTCVGELKTGCEN